MKILCFCHFGGFIMYNYFLETFNEIKSKKEGKFPLVKLLSELIHRNQSKFSILRPLLFPVF